MFLVQLSHNTISKQIEELDHKSRKKEMALQDSIKQLKENDNTLTEFIKKDEETT